MNNPSPVNSQAPINYSPSFTYRVVGQSNKEVVVLNSSLKPLYLGQLLIFDDGVKGYVSSIDSLTSIVVLESESKSLLTTSFSWCNLTELKSVYVNPNFIVGSLVVFCAGLKMKSPGYMGWSLYNSQGVVILAGNDSVQLGACKHSSSELWKPGIYKLEVREFIKEGLQPISYATKTWNLSESRSVINLGNYDDIEGRLLLQ